MTVCTVYCACCTDFWAPRTYTGSVLTGPSILERFHTDSFTPVSARFHTDSSTPVSARFHTDSSTPVSSRFHTDYRFFHSGICPVPDRFFHPSICPVPHRFLPGSTTSHCTLHTAVIKRFLSGY